MLIKTVMFRLSEFHYQIYLLLMEMKGCLSKWFVRHLSFTTKQPIVLFPLNTHTHTQTMIIRLIISPFTVTFLAFIKMFNLNR